MNNKNKLLKRYSQIEINKNLYSTVCISGLGVQDNFLTLEEFKSGKTGYIFFDKNKNKAVFKE